KAGDILRACGEAGIETAKAFELVCAHISRIEKHDTAGLMRRHILDGLARSVLQHDESELASFLTYGFAELDFHVRPTRQDLVLALFKSIMQVLQELNIPVVVAFDQLEDLLLARRTDDGHRTAESFFAGIVQAMHQLDGISFLIFAERGLWNRFVPSLDGYIRDRLNNPIHLPNHGSLKTLRLEAPPLDLVRRIVEARLRPALEKLPDFADLSPIFPFTEEQIALVARTEPTLRDMLQQFRHQFDHVVFGHSADKETRKQGDKETEENALDNRLPEAEMPPEVKSVIVVDSKTDLPSERAGSVSDGMPAVAYASGSFASLWDQELRTARRKLEPDGALTGATRELQSGLGAFLQLCHEHGVKVGPWRLHHVVGEWTFGDHPTYGVMTIAHWVCKDGQPWKVGIGLFLGRGPAKPRDLSTKLSALEVEPSVIDHLILLRPEDDLTLSGKSKALWQESERRGRHARLEPVSLDGFAALSALPRFVASLTESLPEGQPLPNLADLLQEKCEKLLEQVCMPVQG
ncbi:MAG TPA: hypothetical protein VMF69_00610, partial [Gemmataceae bacterium]|nr:hypothetical protein [Gemmataceae bacterium]